MAIYLVYYIISFILARQHSYMLSGLVLITAALWLHVKDYRETDSLTHLRGFFCLFFVDGQGISCFKLSHLQTDRDLRTWACPGLTALTFQIVFEVLHRIYNGRSVADTQPVYRFCVSAESLLQVKRLSYSMMALVVIPFLTFFSEAWGLGSVSLSSYGASRAYSYFHVSGVHYFMASCVLIPSLFVVHSPMISRRGRGLIRDQGLWLGLLTAVLSLTVPVLCVSRFQLILTVGIATFTYISMSDTSSPVYVGVLMVCIIPAYLLLTVVRSRSVEYLNGIFKMKNNHMLIFITQPYIHTTNNYDNFNCLVEQLESHSLGLRILFPVQILMGLKLLFPALASFLLSVTKKELTTLILFCGAYYGFGILGMVLSGVLLGATCYFLVRRRWKMSCSASYVIYTQIIMCMTLSFFTTWFSNLAAWPYLVVTSITYMYVKS